MSDSPAPNHMAGSGQKKQKVKEPPCGPPGRVATDMKVNPINIKHRDAQESKSQNREVQEGIYSSTSVPCLMSLFPWLQSWEKMNCLHHPRDMKEMGGHAEEIKTNITMFASQALKKKEGKL